jgi:Tfp pilus assembly protein PilF
MLFWMSHMIRSVIVTAALLAGASFAGASALAKPTAAPMGMAQQLITRAQAAAAQSKPNDALDLYEAALAADPTNIAAYVGLGRSYETIGMQGRALRYYRLALDINPNDLTVLEAQALGMIAKGAPTKAQVPLDRIRKLCPKGCPSLARVDAAFAKSVQKTGANSVVVPRAALPVKKTVTR